MKPINPISSDSSHDLGNRDNLPGLLNGIIKKFIQGQVDNCLPAIVVSFDQENNRVEVQPLIKVLLSNGDVKQRGTLVNIPVFNNGNQKMSLRFNLSKGDLGWIKSSDRDISLFKQSLSEEKPNTLRQHDFSDSVFYPDAMRGMLFTADAIMSNEAGTIKTEWFSNSIVHTAPTVTLDSDTAECTGSLTVDVDATITGLFGCNAKPAQAAFALNAAATTPAEVLALVNQIRLALIANGIAI